MTETRTKAVKPESAVVTMARVIRSTPVSTGFIRVTLAMDHYDGFAALGFDQWVRMYFPSRPGSPLQLPGGGADGWYARLLEMDDAVRPVVRNYTMRDQRRVGSGWELDIDFVIHRALDTGEVDGVAARWARDARAGDAVGLLDQGTMFAPRTDDGRLLDGRIVVVADESGLPGAEGIARSLPRSARADFVIEVPHADDRRELVSSADITVHWDVRDAGARPGAAALARLRSLELDPRGYVYAVAERTAALEMRASAHRAGVPKAQVDFCAYWRIGRRSARPVLRAA